MLYTPGARRDRTQANNNVADGIIRESMLRGIGNPLHATFDEKMTETSKEAISHKVREAAGLAWHATERHRGNSRKQPPREITDGNDREERVAAAAKRMTAGVAATSRSVVRATRRFVVRGGQQTPEGRKKGRRFELATPAIRLALGQAVHPPKGRSTPQRFEIRRSRRATAPLPVQTPVVPGVVHACVSPGVVPLGVVMSSMPRQVSARKLNKERE